MFVLGSRGHKGWRNGRPDRDTRRHFGAGGGGRRRVESTPVDDGPYYLDDLSVGQRFTTGEYVLDADGAVAFASQWDPQPFHTDKEAAAGSFFGELVASGWHTAAITMRLLVEGLPIAGGGIGAGGEIAWPTPTRPRAGLDVEGGGVGGPPPPPRAHPGH